MEKTKRRILCVDDDRDTCVMLEVILSQSGYEVRSVLTMDDALTLAKAEGFDLYLLDTLLPDGTGFELCRQIRAFDSRAPILFCSGAAYDADIQKAMRAGAQGYLVKPLGIENLMETVSKCLTPTGARSRAT